MVPPAAWDAAAQIGHRERTVARNLVERKVQAHKAREALARSAPDLALKPRPTGWTKTAKQVELEEAAIAAAARQSKADDALYEANSTQRAAPWAASHVLVSRALGPVAGRAIAAERRQLLRQVDDADARARAVQHELLEAHGRLPESRARETAAKEREVQARHERDAAYAAAELARLETERVRLVAPPVIARADRAEAQLEDFRQQAWSDVAALREQLEVTTADWRCAEAEAQQHAMDLAVARADLRHSEERCAVAEARAAEEASRAQEKLAAAAEERKVLDAHNNQLEREKAALEGELRALERRFDAEQEPVREERKTLREAVDAAEARTSLVASQMAVVEQDRHAMRQEVAALRLELDARSEQHELRVSRLASEAQGAAGLAQTLGERLREAEAQRDRLAAELEQCRRGQEDEDDTMAKAHQMLLAERRRADAAEEARREAERSRYLGLHRPPADTTPSASLLNVPQQ